MTPEEWADEVLDVTDGDHTRFPTVADVIRAAIAAEREACAKIADEYALGPEFSFEARLHDNATNIASDIRARKE
jgi:Ni,Fe-hydrogenase III component G